jgi:hypothetical protein
LDPESRRIHSVAKTPCISVRHTANIAHTRHKQLTPTLQPILLFPPLLLPLLVFAAIVLLHQDHHNHGDQRSDSRIRELDVPTRQLPHYPARPAPSALQRRLPRRCLLCGARGWHSEIPDPGEPLPGWRRVRRAAEASDFLLWGRVQPVPGEQRHKGSAYGANLEWHRDRRCVRGSESRPI